MPTRPDLRRATASASAPFRQLPRLAQLSDFLTLTAASLAAVLLRQSWDFFPQHNDVTERVGVAGPLMVAVWIACLGVCGGYQRGVFEAGTEEFQRVAAASGVTFGIVGAGCYMFHFELSRGFLFLAFIFGAPALLLTRFALRACIHRARTLGSLRHNVLLAGSPANVDDVAVVLQREPRLGFNVLGAVLPVPFDLQETPRGIPVVGNTDEMLAKVKHYNADVLFLAAGATTSHEAMRDLVWDLESLDVQVVVAPNISDIARDRVRLRPVGGLPLMHIDPPRGQKAIRWGKRTFDFMASSVLLMMAAPLFAWTALQIKVHDRGPVLFRQVRTGRDGIQFSCLKFRTMVVNAEAMLVSLHADSGYESGLFKLKDDPRVTGPGKWLRRFSIDELPQLINVWRGDMSLVGPRPPLPSEVEQYVSWAHRRLRVRPGLTGLWQVSGRSDLSFDDAIRLDLYYVDNWSVFQDFSILAKTVGAVLGKKGAY